MSGGGWTARPGLLTASLVVPAVAPVVPNNLLLGPEANWGDWEGAPIKLAELGLQLSAPDTLTWLDSGIYVIDFQAIGVPVEPAGGGSVAFQVFGTNINAMYASIPGGEPGGEYYPIHLTSLIGAGSFFQAWTNGTNGAQYINAFQISVTRLA